MSLQKNNAEGGTSGTTVTTANSGGISGTAPATVNIGAGCTQTFDSAAAADGSLGYKFVTASGVDCNQIYNFPGTKQGPERITFRVVSLPTGNPVRIAAFLNSSLSNYCAVAVTSAGNLQIINNAGTAVWTSSGTITANTWYELDLKMDNSAGSSAGTCDLQVCAKSSTTPIANLSTSLTGQTFGGGQITYLAIGKSGGGTGVVTLHIDNIAWQDGSTSFIGLVASGANAGVDTTGNEPLTVVTLDGSASSGGSFAWAFTSATNGTTGATITNPNAQIASFVAPANWSGTDVTFTLTVDGSATDTVVHSILPALEWRWDGSVWHPDTTKKY